MKKICIISNIVLLFWFFLDMIGFSLANQTLVSQSWKDDGVFFVIYLGVFIWFLRKEKSGKFALLCWLFLWFVIQFYSHWYFTIAGPWEGKMRYFSDTIKLIPSSTVYIPDLYHFVLHVLILFAFCLTMIYTIKLCKD